MSDQKPLITSAGSLLGASLGSAIGALIVLPIGFLLSIWYRSHWLFFLTFFAFLIVAGSGEYWIRRFRYRFDFQQQIVEMRSRWLFWPGRARVLNFADIQSFQVGTSRQGSPLLLMLLRSGRRRIVKTGSRQRLEPLWRELSRLVQSPDAGSEVHRRAGSSAQESGSSEYLRTGVVSQQTEPEKQAVPIPMEIPTLQSEISPSTIPPLAAATTVFPPSDLPFSSMQKLKVGIIGGSGLGKLLGSADHARKHEMHTPFGAPSDAIFETEWAGIPVFLLSRHGPGHLLNPSQVPYQANIYALKQLGCTHIIASGAVGSLREEMKPRDLVIPDQIIDKTTTRPATFYNNLAVHVEFSEPFCPLLRQTILEAGAAPADHAVHDRGCYIVMEGPAFSTRAESLMHRLWGGDLIGMTVMPEAKLAREAEISYALVALVTDYDCWRQKSPPAPGQPQTPADPSALLNEIIGNLETASANAMALIRKSIELIATRQEQLMAAPSRDALRLAIWSDRAKIAPDEISRLHVLWARHFEVKNAE